MRTLPIGPRIRAVRFVALSALVCAGCLFRPDDRVADGGGSSETTNGLVLGMVRNPDGSPAAGARVVLRPRTYLEEGGAAMAKLALQVAETVTDSTGRFQLDSIDAGDYFLEANDSRKSGALFEFSTGGRDTFLLGEKLMKPTGTVVGTVAADSGRLGNAVVQIYGMERLARADAAGRFEFTDLPEGTYTLRAHLTSTAADPRVISGVQAVGLDTTDLGRLELASFDSEDYASWPHSRKFTLNTTPSGADVKSNIVDFPLLIRLNALNFDFTQSDGRDIRFRDGNGKRLRYQIERWDAVNRQAEVWVRIKTVHANSRQDEITLFWGKTGAPDWSDGRQVFDSSAGFGGVWHLSEESPDTTVNGLYSDATPSAQNGDDHILSTATEGIIGAGHRFRLGDRIRVTPSVSLRPAKTLLISGWFRGKTTDADGGTIAGLGDSYGLRIEKDGNVRFFTSMGKGKAWQEVTTKNVNVLDSTWHHLVGIFSGTDLRVYVDGAEKAKASGSTAIAYNMGPDFFIGRHGNGKTQYDLEGDLDEVNVSFFPRGAQYAKLCFESQRMNPTLVEFEP